MITLCAPRKNSPEDSSPPSWCSPLAAPSRPPSKRSSGLPLSQLDPNSLCVPNPKLGWASDKHIHYKNFWKPFSLQPTVSFHSTIPPLGFHSTRTWILTLKITVIWGLSSDCAGSCWLWSWLWHFQVSGVWLFQVITSKTRHILRPSQFMKENQTFTNSVCNDNSDAWIHLLDFLDSSSQ